MNRRTLLKALSVVPFVGALAESTASASVEPVQGLPDNVLVFEDWKLMAEQLWVNFQSYAATMPDWWQPDHLKIMEPVCYRFCRALLATKQEEAEASYPTGFGPGALSAEFYPQQDPDLVRKNVRFGVAMAPLVTFDGQIKPAEARKLRLTGFHQMCKAMEDLRAFHSIDAEVEMIATCADQVALEVMSEIRGDWKDGRKVRMYALYMPPFLSSVDPKMAENFSVDRRWRMRYAKFEKLL